MRKILVMMLALTSASAWAEPEFQPAPVVRKVKLIGTINKDTIEREESKIRINTEKVCSFEVTSDLVDMREPNRFIQFTSPTNCATTIGGAAVDIVIGSFMTLSNGWDGRAGPTKTATAYLLARSKGTEGPQFQQNLDGNAGTRDVNSPSLLVHLADLYMAGTDLPGLEERISASLEFVDDQQ